MINKFKKRPLGKPRKYTYVPPTSIHDDEAVVYRKLGVIAVLVLILAVALYLWGIPLVVQLGSLWGRFGGNVPETLQQPEDPTIITPRLNPLPSTVRNLAEVVISGTGPAGNDIAIYINDERQVTVLADASGRFEVKDLKLVEGENEIYAKTNTKNSESEASNRQIVTYDITPPTISIISPSSGTVTTESEIEIVGNTEAQAVVIINGVQIIVNATTGDFARQFPLEPGENTFTILARDKGGNERNVTLTITREGGETPTPETQPEGE